MLTAIGLPGINGIEATRQILRCCPDRLIVVVTVYNNEDLVTSATNVGARAYMEKTTSSGELLYGLRTVISGGTYLAHAVAEALRRRAEYEAKEEWTPVELEIQQFLATGQTNEQIALILNLRLDVVISYRSSIKKKSLAKLKAALYDLRQPRK